MRRFSKATNSEMSLRRGMLWNYCYLNPRPHDSLNGSRRFISENGLKDLLEAKIDDESPLSHHPPQATTSRWRITHGHSLRRGVLLVRQRPAHHHGRHAPGGVPRGVGDGAGLRKPDQDQARLAERGPRRRDHPHLHRQLPQGTSTTTCTRTRRSPRRSSETHPRAERERKELAGIKNLARERAKKASLHNKKLRDCRVHFGTRHKRRGQHLFITEGDSASGSITKSRDVEDAGGLLAARQAAQLLRPAAQGGLRERGVQPAAGRAQHRGRHRGPALQQGRHRHRCRRRRHAHPPAAAHVLPAVLPRADPRRPPVHPADAALPRAQQEGDHLLLRRGGARAAIAKLGKQAEITRFKGLGEISPDEFKFMIGPDMRLDPVNLRVEKDVVEEEIIPEAVGQ
jgi:hypothetical protein